MFTLLLAGDSVVVSTNSTVRVGHVGASHQQQKMEMFYPPDERRRRRVGPRCLFGVAFSFHQHTERKKKIEEEKALQWRLIDFRVDGNDDDGTLMSVQSSTVERNIPAYVMATRNVEKSKKRKAVRYEARTR